MCTCPLLQQASAPEDYYLNSVGGSSRSSSDSSSDSSDDTIEDPSSISSTASSDSKESDNNMVYTSGRYICTSSQIGLS